MNKFLLIAVASFATLSLAANPLKGWTYTRSDLAKANPASIKKTAKNITLTGIPKVTWSYFKPAPVKAVKGQNIEISFKASGKGKVQVGYYEYRSGFSSTGVNLKNVVLNNKMEAKKVIVTVKAAATTLIRPAIFVAPDGQITLTEYSLKVIPVKK